MEGDMLKTYSYPDPHWSQFLRAGISKNSSSCGNVMNAFDFEQVIGRKHAI
jgi:hypothetical protein